MWANENEHAHRARKAHAHRPRAEAVLLPLPMQRHAQLNPRSNEGAGRRIHLIIFDSISLAELY